VSLSKEETEILAHIREGISDTHQLKAFTGLNLDKLKVILGNLEKAGLIKLIKKYDKHYREDFWDASLTEKA